MPLPVHRQCVKEDDHTGPEPGTVSGLRRPFEKRLVMRTPEVVANETRKEV